MWLLLATTFVGRAVAGLDADGLGWLGEDDAECGPVLGVGEGGESSPAGNRRAPPASPGPWPARRSGRRHSPSASSPEAPSRRGKEGDPLDVLRAAEDVEETLFRGLRGEVPHEEDSHLEAVSRRVEGQTPAMTAGSTATSGSAQSVQIFASFHGCKPVFGRCNSGKLNRVISLGIARNRTQKSGFTKFEGGDLLAYLGDFLL